MSISTLALKKFSKTNLLTPLPLLFKDNILETLNNVFKEVEDATTKLAKLTIEKLSDMNPEIAKELKPEFQKPSWDKVFSCGLDSDLNIPLNTLLKVSKILSLFSTSFIAAFIGSCISLSLS